MQMIKTANQSMYRRLAVLVALITSLIAISARSRAETAICGGASTTIPFTDVPASNVFFCQIAAAFFSGLTNGTTATTYSPAADVTREQMAAFVSRTLDQSLRRGSHRAALGQWWTPQRHGDLVATTVGNLPLAVKADGFSLWVANVASDSVTRVNASTGAVISTATGIDTPRDVLVAKGKVFVIQENGTLVSIDPTLAALPVTTVISGLGSVCSSLAFDGSRMWVVANGTNQVVRVRLETFIQVDTFSGFVDPRAVIFDGSNIWVVDNSGTSDATIKKVDPGDGSIALTVTLVGASFPGSPTFDGTNLWIPDQSGKLFVVRASTTTDSVLATLTGNGLTAPTAAAFDGERILVTNNAARPNASLSLWKASSLTPITSVSLNQIPEDAPIGVCSDGINFWVTTSLGASTPGRLLRF
jgi:hypothetical protein